MAEPTLTEQESLRIITEMIQKAKSDFKETGISALLWGSVIGFCGLFSFFSMQFNFNIHHDVWMLTVLAFIPQIMIFIRERKKRKAKQLDANTLGNVWMVFGISVVLLTFYQNAVGAATETFLQKENITWISKNTNTNVETILHPFVPSASTLYLLLYAMPTMITGLTRKYKPMIIGAIITYVLLIISIYTDFKIDSLFQGIAGIVCWFIPGLILYRRYKKAQSC